MITSVCTLAKGRGPHLVNLVLGLIAQERQPDELVIAVMQATAYDLPRTAFPVRQLILGANGMRLAQARNAAARASSGEQLMFLDVDCIPDPRFVADYARHLDMIDAVLMGEVLYLPAGTTDLGLDFDLFCADGVKHCDRPGPPVGPLGDCKDYGCFWSLNFAMRRETYLAVGGFDESYIGYGGEDTDFAKTVEHAGIELKWCRGARAFHQYHPHHMPPVHHIDSVIANATRFREKWGHYTMEHWLRAFSLMGLIEVRDGELVRLRHVHEVDLALTRQQTSQPFASTAKVLALLEARASAMAAA